MRNDQLLSAIRTGRECMKIRNMGYFGWDGIANHRFVLCKGGNTRFMSSEALVRLFILPNARHSNRNCMAKRLHINAAAMGSLPSSETFLR